MIERNVIKVGTSVGVTLPKEFVDQERVRIGDRIQFEPQKVSSRKQAQARKTIRPEVIEWVNQFIEEDRDLLELLKNA